MLLKDIKLIAVNQGTVGPDRGPDRGPGALLCSLSDSAYKLIPALFFFLVLASATSGLNLPATPQRSPPGGSGALRLQELLGVTGACSSPPGTTSTSKAVHQSAVRGQTGIFSLARSSYMSHLLKLVFVCCFSSPHLSLHTEPR